VRRADLLEREATIARGQASAARAEADRRVAQCSAIAAEADRQRNAAQVHWTITAAIIECKGFNRTMQASHDNSNRDHVDDMCGEAISSENGLLR
jgi:hypothetical protein